MPKNIVFCSDGTWNHPGSPVTVTEADTNVYKLYKLLEVTAEQATFYDDGVGAEGLPVDRLLGGAFGTGLYQKVKDGYTAIAHVYERGDRIFIFGFSRGAYTARSVAGMIAACGLPTANYDQQLVNQAFAAYRDRNHRAELLKGLQSYGMDNNPQIQMVGVWDTVGALGIPGAIFGDNDNLLYGFLDTSLNPKVLNAFQAVSIDERRNEFRPTLWTSAPAPNQTLEQVWFTGAHCDVGGGYAECGLSDITLSWMLGKATALGIKAIPQAAAKYQNIDAKHALDQAHESWNVLWGFPLRRTVPNNSCIANSVDIRIRTEGGYRPANLVISSAGILTGYSSAPTVVTAQPAAAGN